ncbi:hypothetical protein PVAP13_2NG329403 [Panicum virgatum]|uniref:Uncharacterized protein n=1 Tax=Panicum virgatum TaxID=38727 RepID=A0A8T0VJ53_PANVG|nr:hypothetical protein PVAP13_2NG329403 [Panicum virgatum]
MIEKELLDIDYIHSTSSNKRTPGKEKVATPESPAPTAAAAAAAAFAGGSNYKLFSELEAIYKPGRSGVQMGSGSGLTGDDNAILDPAMANLPGVVAPDAPQLNTSDTSAGEDAAAVVQPPQPQPLADPDRASAAAREAAIIACLEKISGESIALPPPAAASGDDTSQDAGNELVPYDGGGGGGDTAPAST